jgi:hypothetical protein
MNNQLTVQNLAKISIGFGCAFLILLTTLHFLKPEFNPTWRMISEYEIGKYGFLMTIAFFCWGAGFLSLDFAMWKSLDSIGGKIGKWWLLIIGIALFGAGIFTTQPITDVVRGTTDRLHALCGVMMIFTFPICALFLSVALAKKEAFKIYKNQIFGVTLLAWIGFFAFFAAVIIFAPKDRMYNESVKVGYPNRFLVLNYTIWLISIARIFYKQQK